MQGREVEVAVLGNDAPIASVPGEVCYAGEWYDYETKYGAGQTTFKVPAALPPETTAWCAALADPGVPGDRRRRAWRAWTSSSSTTGACS